jgi:two-component system sensor kinase FixL
VATFADIKSGRNIFDMESIHLKKDGTSVYLSFNAVVMRDADGKVMGTQGTAKDISDRVRAEEITRLHQTELAHVTRVSTMGEMATSLAHELNQPLTATMNYIDGCLLRLKSGEPISPKIVEALEKTSQETHRAGDIIRQLRTFIGKVDQKFEKVSINDAVRVVAAMARPELQQHRIDLRLDLDKTDPIVAGHEILLQQVILNLVRNATEALQKMGVNQRILTISTAENAGEITLVVSDNGPGVAADKVEHLFQPFNTDKEGGLGLGLAICRSVIESHGGQIGFAPTAEQGAAFNIQLPSAPLNLDAESVVPK